MSTTELGEEGLHFDGVFFKHRPIISFRGSTRTRFNSSCLKWLHLSAAFAIWANVPRTKALPVALDHHEVHADEFEKAT